MVAESRDRAVTLQRRTVDVSEPWVMLSRKKSKNEPSKPAEVHGKYVKKETSPLLRSKLNKLLAQLASVILLTKVKTVLKNNKSGWSECVETLFVNYCES